MNKPHVYPNNNDTNWWHGMFICSLLKLWNIRQFSEKAEKSKSDKYWYSANQIYSSLESLLWPLLRRYLLVNNLINIKLVGNCTAMSKLICNHSSQWKKSDPRYIVIWTEFQWSALKDEGSIKKLLGVLSTFTFSSMPNWFLWPYIE